MTRRQSLVVFLLLVLLAGCGAPVATGPHSLDMPPFTERLAEEARSIYDMVWTEDGYPGRLEPDGSVYAHPLYGVYVLSDYLGQYERQPTDQLRAAIRMVSDAVLRRMEEFEDSLVFWYEATADVSRAYKRHYSALTQGYYARELHRAGRVLGDEALTEAGARVFSSVLIPATRGGVMFEDVHGVSIAEVPQEPNSYILNGWLSSLISISRYADLAESDDARRIVEESARAMARLLDLYDVPEYASSRYGLTGFLYVRLSSDVSAKVERARLTVPGEGDFEVEHLDDPSRWQSYFLDESRMNIVVSRASYPEPNRLRMTVRSSAAGTGTFQAYARGVFDPRFSGPTQQEWTDIERVPLRRGTQTVEVSLPWDELDLVVFPTEFGNTRNGHHTNVYHSIHVEGLRRMAEIVGDDTFLQWSRRWLDYMCEWGSMDVYQSLWANTPDGRHVPVTEICE